MTPSHRGPIRERRWLSVADDGAFDVRHMVAGDRWPPLVILSFMSVVGISLLGYSVVRREVLPVAFMTLWVGGVAWSWPDALHQPWQLTLRGSRLSWRSWMRNEVRDLAQVRLVEQFRNGSRVRITFDDDATMMIRITWTRFAPFLEAIEQAVPAVDVRTHLWRQS